ncbi:hypothetical protein TcCL_NonESM10132 [Trypanosoma cruzi]|uniref:A-kinase anchor protein 7-like phosphoesterase domain-containing protein n=2 Tax=Trypanosoma cruzi TaxID=5693 RepID=Q4CP69_TRYCC|nr:hypothetical protein, conserved [Trypanosoma cruzi]EAN82071.1 hypothetical protein, conserved [Trypanosoma cruzi]RNC40392.1 hypothetical protein TcCL_NonESM10132 [Trypanosoma cruzi]|eukprot:XP_803922.1 hypothetical protein [Trypanosoma cruzi strain CL Brener]
MLCPLLFCGRYHWELWIPDFSVVFFPWREWVEMDDSMTQGRPVVTDGGVATAEGRGMARKGKDGVRVRDCGGSRRGLIGAGQERLHGWRCPICMRDSVDPRRVCGFCLAVEPGVVEFNPRRGAAVACSQACLGFSEDPTVRLLSLPHGRCYRIAAQSTTAALPTRQHLSLEATVTFGNTQAGKREGITVERQADEAVHGGSSPHRTTSYTHFVSLPIGSLSAVRLNATRLLEEMKTRCVDPAAMVTEDIFTTAPRMHITLLMLSLPTPEAITLAKACMRVLEEKLKLWQETQHSNTDNGDCGSLKIHLGGLHVMHGRGRNEKKADVLYMGLMDAASSAVVKTLQQLVYECFSELIANDPRGRATGRLLHMTLLNTKWRGEKNPRDTHEEATRTSSRVPFDATCIRQEFGHVSLRGGGTDGAIVLERVDLNALNYDSECECYNCECSVPL